MLTVRNIDSWYPFSIPDWIEENPVFLKIAKNLYKEGYETWLESLDSGEGNLLNEGNTFIDFARDELYHDGDCILEILEVYAREKEYKSVFADAYIGDNEDYWTIHLVQVIPETKDDLVELMEVYMEDKGMSPNLVEPVIDKIIRDE